MFTPEKRTLSFRLNKSVSGSPVRALPEVKCIIAWACRYASKFNAKKPAMNAAPTTSNQRLILFFKSASLVDTNFTNYREFQLRITSDGHRCRERQKAFNRRRNSRPRGKIPLIF